MATAKNALNIGLNEVEVDKYCSHEVEVKYIVLNEVKVD